MPRRQETKSNQKKRYDSLADILASPEFKTFMEKKEQEKSNSILAKIAKKNGIKLKSKIDLSRNIVMDATEFYNSSYNEL